MDKKIQDAAGDHLPPFQEKDWDRMESLLNKHLPQEKKKRPFLFGLTFLLLAGIPVLFMLTTYKRPPALVAERISTPSANHPGSSTAAESPVAIPAEITDDKEPPVAELLTNDNHSKTSAPNPLLTTLSYKSQKSPGSRRINEKNSVQASTGSPVEKNSNDLPAKMPATSISGKEEPVVIQGGTNLNTQGENARNDPAIPETMPDSTANKDSMPAEEKLPEEKKKSPKDESKSGKLQINFSAGPDLSMIGMDKAGQWKMQYGIGASYAFSKRWQVRAGFFVSRKLYTADSSDYHPPKNFWNYYTNLQKIDANCLVYEIPLNVIYSFPSAKKHQWFVSAGVSSYLMKEENYDYYYKNAWGGVEYRSRSIENENDHFFSIVQLSGGYQHQFSDRFSLMAEPYFKFPMGGVGFGKVKLNNTGVLFTLGYKPFLKKGR